MASDLFTQETFAMACALRGLHASEQHLSELQLTMTDEDAALAGAAIAASTTLKRLKLRKVHRSGTCIIRTWTDAPWRMLLEGVGKSVSLSSLSLVCNTISSCAATALGVALNANSRLVTLDLGWCRMSSWGGVGLIRSLSANSSLTEICLAFNVMIGDEGATAMGLALKTNSTLMRLDLGRCGMSSIGCAVLCDGLCEAAGTVSLSELSFSYNPIKDKGAEAVRRMLTVVTSLTKLHLAGCVGEKGCEAVCQGIANSPSLRELDLQGVGRNSHEGIPDQAKDAIAKVLASNTRSIKILNDFGLEQGPAHGRMANAGIGDSSLHTRLHVVDKGMVNAQQYARAQGKRGRTLFDAALPESDCPFTKYHKPDQQSHGEGGGGGAAVNERARLQGRAAKGHKPKRDCDTAKMATLFDESLLSQDAMLQDAMLQDAMLQDAMLQDAMLQDAMLQQEWQGAGEKILSNVTDEQLCEYLIGSHMHFYLPERYYPADKVKWRCIALDRSCNKKGAVFLHIRLLESIPEYNGKAGLPPFDAKMKVSGGSNNVRNALRANFPSAQILKDMTLMVSLLGKTSIIAGILGGSVSAAAGERDGGGGEEVGDQREEAGAAASVCVKIEEYDGSYECVICSQSVRGDAAVLHCSQCSSNPFHQSCVEKTEFMHKCPQCSRNTVVPWSGSEGSAVMTSSEALLTINLTPHS